ncbi:acyltransferase family protein [Microvirga antarctica]|uniref:acyltransferase family protein n=1 Tax=Microvirga antarctica TaxID=2819233 RepID=UPI001B3177BF|nr:acyltransferase family protein [Microvirga antarctica]
MTTFRNDIQALRGLAVVLVVLYHAQIGGLESGFLGVDVFFVISGYLITRIVRDDIQNGKFTFGNFYFRRAKRILPSAYLTIFVTVLASQYFLTKTEYQQFVLQVFGSVAYVANVVLWRQTDYFGTGAIFKPLLHMWSLSIEEQYYLLLPAALVFVPRRLWSWGAWLVLFVSLALCLVMVPWKPSLAFYLLPTRAWELAIGSVGALALAHMKPARPFTWLLGPALMLLLVVPALPLIDGHPGGSAILVCVATLVVILCRSEALNANIAVRGLAKIGDFSYSLYLVHWPLFAYAHNVYLSTEVPLPVRAGLLALSFVLGYALYRFVESPIRRAKILPTRQVIAGAVAASVILVATPFALVSIPSSDVDYVAMRRGNMGFGAQCEFNGDFTPKPECRNAAAPKMLVWGDSNAMHLVPGIAATTDAGVVQATRSVCGPFLNLAPLDDRHQRPWAEECLKFNQSVLTFLADTPSIEVVVLSSAFGQFLTPPNRLLREVDGKLVEVDAGLDAAIGAMRETVDKIRGMGKRVAVIAPPPKGKFDIGLCLERQHTGKMTLGPYQSCDIGLKDYHEFRAEVIAFIRRLAKEVDVDVIGFDDVLCSAQSCRTAFDDTFIYLDDAHLSNDGSRLLAQHMQLGQRLMNESW